MNRPFSRQAVEVVRIAYGVALLAVPERVAEAVTGREPGDTTVAVMRVLGARHVIQGALLVGTRSTTVGRLATAVDLLHLASLGPIALVADGRDRRLVGADAVMEALFAAAAEQQ